MKKLFSAFICIAAILCLSVTVFCEEYDLDGVISDVAGCMVSSYPSPSVGSVGGEWAIFGLARSGEKVPDGYFEKYCENVESYLRERGGVLSDRKYTEYSRLVIALASLGKDPRNVSGYDLVSPLLDYDSTVRQGINGAIFALIALDCGGADDEQTTSAKEKYLAHILERQTNDGGWTLSGNDADADVTAMALQAIAFYRERDNVKAASDRALSALSKAQKENGGFETVGTETAESIAQVITALCEYGISPDDERFAKNGKTAYDCLMTYYVPHKGFKHVKNADDTDAMATEQAFYALAAMRRFYEGQSSLYNMADASDTPPEGDDYSFGLPGKHTDVRKAEVTGERKTFQDAASDKNREKIEALAERGIINGKSDGVFDPDSSMTRAEYAAIVVRSLGLPFHSSDAFLDVDGGDWFYDYIGTAYYYGIVKGLSDTEFNPGGTITREEAYVMTARAARLAGIDGAYGAFEARNILAAYIDYVKISDWAVEDVAFCADKGIADTDELEIRAKEAVTRSEVAFMIYNMLSLSRLL